MADTLRQTAAGACWEAGRAEMPHRCVRSAAIGRQFLGPQPFGHGERAVSPDCDRVGQLPGTADSGTGVSGPVTAIRTR